MKSFKQYINESLITESKKVIGTVGDSFKIYHKKANDEYKVHNIKKPEDSFYVSPHKEVDNYGHDLHSNVYGHTKVIYDSEDVRGYVNMHVSHLVGKHLGGQFGSQSKLVDSISDHITNHLTRKDGPYGDEKTKDIVAYHKQKSEYDPPL